MNLNKEEQDELKSGGMLFVCLHHSEFISENHFEEETIGLFYKGKEGKFFEGHFNGCNTIEMEDVTCEISVDDARELALISEDMSKDKMKRFGLMDDFTEERELRKEIAESTGFSWEYACEMMDLDEMSDKFFNDFADNIVWDEIFSNETITTEFAHRHIEAIGGTLYFKDGLMHREDGPAAVYPDYGVECWYKFGELHRTDGPAVIDDEGEEYWRKGVHYNEDGSKFIYRDDSYDLDVMMFNM